MLSMGIVALELAIRLIIFQDILFSLPFLFWIGSGVLYKIKGFGKCFIRDEEVWGQRKNWKVN